MSAIDIAAEMRAHVARHYRTQLAAAAAWGVSAAFVSAVLNGHKRPTDAMLAEIGFARVVSYVKVQP